MEIQAFACDFNVNSFVTSISCYGGSDGRIDLSLTGGESPYSYNWSTGATSENLVNISAGTYSVTVTDNAGCSTVSTVTLLDPNALSISTSVISYYEGEDISCEGGTDGQAFANASGGAGGFTYLWSNGQIGSNLTNVGAGTYSVTATDANGCEINAVIELQDPPTIVVSANVTSDYNGSDVTCAGDIDGSALVTATGGIGNFSYTWNNGQTGPVLSNVSAGVYSVTATDEYGCWKEANVTIVNPTIVEVSISVTSDYNGYPLSCSKAKDGSATASASGGVGGYTFHWSNGHIASSISNIGAGTYSVTVTDENGCFAAAFVDFFDPPPLTFYITSSDPTDCGVNDGVILINSTGGVGTYEYSLNGIDWQSTNSFTGLAPGTYQTYVRNSFGTCEVGPIAEILDVPEAPTTDNITVINPSVSGSNDGGILITASGNGMALEYSIDGVSWQADNLFENLSEGTYTTYVRYQNFNCLSISEITLIEGGGVVGNNSGAGYCSDGQSGIQFVNTYYIPFPEDQVLSALSSIYPGGATCGKSNSSPADPVISYNSIGVVETGTTIYYDHWEDGYEISIGFPIQPSTEIWGDGDLSNGVAPGYPLDYFSAGDIIILQDDVVSTTRSSVIDFDGGDKIASLGNLAFTRLAWTTGPGTYFAGALEVYPDIQWGYDFEIPVGENADVNGMFEYVGAIIMASENGTNLTIDSDNDGSIDIITSINEGESYLVDGNLNYGASISASNKVQVHLITGNYCEAYETRWFTLTSSEKWTNSYFDPVATQDGSGNSNDPTYVHFYNPNNTAITINWKTEGGVVQTSTNVSAGGVAWIEVPDGTGSHFYSDDEKPFYAIATIDSDASEYMHDWGFALLPESQLTSQITMVGFAPGENPFDPKGGNNSPVWITGGYREGNTGSGSIMLCIDYNGDGGGTADLNGTFYDVSVTINELGLAKIYDPDGDQTGMRIWVCDGSDAIIAGAWGQDPDGATGTGTNEMDLGTGLPNGIPFAASHCVSLSKDYNSNGMYDECDEVMYTIQIRNSGALPLFTESLIIKDTLPSFLNYVDSSTISIAGGIVTRIADDIVPPSATSFPLDEEGLRYNSVILPGDSVVIRFEAEITNLTGAQFIKNIAYVTNGYQEFTPDVTFPAEQPLGPELGGIPDDITVDCDDIPAAPAIGTEITTLNNCEETSLIPRTAWLIQYVDSEDVSSGEIAANAIDGDPNTVWSTQWNGGNPGFPHEIQIDLGGIYNISGFKYLPRQSGAEGRISNFEFYVSTDGSNWGEIQASGIWQNIKKEQEVLFNLVSGQFIRLVANAEVKGNPWASIAELNVLQCTNYVPFNVIFTESSTQTADGSSTDDCYSITRTWQATDHCSRSSLFTQNITVEDDEQPILENIPSDITVTASTIPEPPTIDCLVQGNLAVGKSATQSSTDKGVASNAIDGNTDGDFSNNSVSETFSEKQPWWEVDLGSVNYLKEIEIWNRTDCCSGELSDYYVLISDFPFQSNDLSNTLNDPKVSYFFQANIAGSPTSVSVNRTGRYVRIQLQNKGVLSLAEVKVVPICISATDNCDTEVEIDFSETSNPIACSYDILRTWTATDNCGNISTQEQKIAVVSSLSIAANVISEYNGLDVSCANSSDGTAVAELDGGVEPISINWSDGQSGITASGLSAGTYTVTATDAYGCSATEKITLQGPPELHVSASITSNYNGEHVSCFGSDDGSVFAKAIGGVGTLNYNWSSGQNTQNATGLTAGDYTVTVTDENGCTATADISLQNPPGLFVTTEIISDFNGHALSCNGASDGFVTVSANVGVGELMFLWSNGETGDTLTNLTAGTYYVTVGDENGCNEIAMVTIPEPPPLTLALDSSFNPTTCDGNDGSITVSATGGNGTYKYRLGLSGSWQSSNVFNGLMANNYKIYVSNDEETCMAGPLAVSLSGPIPQSCPIIAEADPLTVCRIDTTSFSVAPSADAIGYMWSLPSGVIILSGEDTESIVVDINNLAAGIYQVCAVTVSNCGYSPDCCFTFEVEGCSEICGNGIDDDGNGLIDCDDPACDPTAEIILPIAACVKNIVSIEAQNAGASAIYSWDFGANATPSNATGIGPHNIVFDECGSMEINLEVALDGCINNASEILLIEDNEQPTFNDIPADVTVECDDVPAISNPTISDNCDNDITLSFSEVRTDGSCQDAYILSRTWIATDDCGNSNTFVQTITVEDNQKPTIVGIPTNLTVECDAVPAIPNPIIEDNCDNDITISFNEKREDGACSDNYSLTRTWTATDNCGNSETKIQTVNVEDNSIPVLSGIPNNVTVHCDEIPTIANPSATDNCDTNVFISFNENQSSSGSSQYILTRSWTATDNCNNSVTETQIITVIDSIEIVLDSFDDETCVGGNIQFSVQPQGTDYSYTWSSDFGSFNNDTIPNPVLATDVEGVYTIEVTILHTSGCSASAFATVTVSQDLVNAAASSNSPVCSGNDIELTGEGGDFYEWSGPNNFSSSDQNPVISNADFSMSGQYTLIVSKINGCTAQEAVEVHVNSGITATFTTQNADCDSLGKIDLNVSGGSGNYSFDWADINLTSEPQNRDSLPSGSYDLTISDDSGCENIIENIVIIDDCITCDAAAGNLTIDNAIACLENGEATVSATSLGNINAPPGFGIIYLLSEQPGDTIIAFENDADFVVNEAGNYTIHTLVYNMSENVVDSISINQTTIFDIEALLIQGGGSICGDLDVGGASSSSMESTFSIEAITIDSCNFSNGSVTLSPDNLDYNWSDGGTGFFRNNLTAGIYQVTATDSNNCSNSIEIEIEGDCDCEMPGIQAQVVDSECGMSIGVAGLIPEGNIADYSFAWSTTSGNLNALGNEMSNLTAGIYTVTVTSLVVPNCYSVEIVVVGNTDGPAPDYVTTSTATCTANNGSVVFEPSSYTYIWLHDSLTAFERYDLPTGIYQINVIDPLNIDCENFIEVEVGQTNPMTAEATILNQPDCNEANGKVEIFVQGGSGNYNYAWSDNVTFDQPVRNDLSEGNYVCTITDLAYPYCESFVAFSLQNVIFGANVVIDPEVSVSCFGQTDGTIIFNTTFEPDFDLPAQEIIQDHSGTIYNNGALPPGDYCLTILSASGCVGAIECFSVTEPELLEANFQVFSGFCENSGTIDISVSGGSGIYSFDWSDLNNGNNPEDRTDVEAGTYNLIVSDENGCTVELSDILVEMVINDDCFENEIFVDTIFVTEMDTFCVDTSELFGNIVSIENACEDASGELVLFETLDNSWCVTYLGIEVGTEEACIVICDDLGFCDTTFMLITVIEIDDGGGWPKPPIAVDDFKTVKPHETISIEVLENDTINGNLEDIYLVTEPSNGLVILNNDGTVAYSIEEASCEKVETDTFDYAICNPVGCDTATVHVTIKCEDLIIYTGVSPNDDGVNDVFYIEGIENYPENTVSVFNRWGNEVFYKESYKNDWNGTWENKALPDGTYFYILEDGTGKSYSGYIQILR